MVLNLNAHWTSGTIMGMIEEAALIGEESPEYPDVIVVTEFEWLNIKNYLEESDIEDAMEVGQLPITNFLKPDYILGIKFEVVPGMAEQSDRIIELLQAGVSVGIMKI